MTFDEFEKHVESLINPELTPKEVVTMAVMGLAGESGELIDSIKKHLFHDVPISWPEAGYELGDILWYVFALRIGLSRLQKEGQRRTWFPGSVEQVAQKNVEKLQRRYPNGFALGGGNR